MFASSVFASSVLNASPATPEPAYTTYARIDLHQLRANALLLKRRAVPGEIMGVVKANAYGHGAVPVARVLLDAGIRHFMVATMPEAIQLREHGIEAPILVGTPPLAGNLKYYSEQNFHVSISSAESASAVLSFAAAGHPLSVHVKIDTGMNRLGLREHEAGRVLTALREIAHFDLYGIWTHLATASVSDTQFARQQLQQLYSVAECQPSFQGYIHAGNSGALLHPETYAPRTDRSLFRLGGSLLGISSIPAETPPPVPLPIMTMISRVLAVKPIRRGETVSYGRTWEAPCDTFIATVGAGYGDGYPGTHRVDGSEEISGVSVHGYRFPVVGKVCMDMLMIDLGPTPPAPVEAGDPAVLFGRDGPPLRELARGTDRKAYEICCGISNRVPRIYVE